MSNASSRPESLRRARPRRLRERMLEVAFDESARARHVVQGACFRFGPERKRDSARAQSARAAACTAARDADRFCGELRARTARCVERRRSARSQRHPRGIPRSLRIASGSPLCRMPRCHPRSQRSRSPLFGAMRVEGEEAQGYGRLCIDVRTKTRPESGHSPPHPRARGRGIDPVDSSRALHGPGSGHCGESVSYPPPALTSPVAVPILVPLSNVRWPQSRSRARPPLDMRRARAVSFGCSAGR